jgi:hypothetical protein
VADGEAGLQVIDISSPTNPKWVGGYETNGYARGVTVSSNHAYVAGTAGLVVIDISTPTDPKQVGGFAMEGDTEGVAVAGNYAFVTGAINDGGAGIEVIDISNPTNPQRVGSLGDLPSSDGVAVFGNYVLVGCRFWCLEVIDVSDPANPMQVGEYHNLTGGWTFCLAVADHYAYVADGYIHNSGARGDGLVIFDITNPTDLRRVSAYHTSGSANGVAVSGNYAYVTDGYVDSFLGDDYSVGLVILDISNPANPQRVGGYRTSTSAYGVAVVGNHAYVAAGQDGLLILEFTELPAFTQQSLTSDGELSLSWNQPALGMKLQRATRLTNPDWQDVVSSETTNRLSLLINDPRAFFRLFKP